MSNTGRGESSSHKPSDGTSDLEFDVYSRDNRSRGRLRPTSTTVGYANLSSHSGPQRSTGTLPHSVPFSNSRLGAPTDLRTLNPAPSSMSTHQHVTHPLSHAWVSSQGSSAWVKGDAIVDSDCVRVLELLAPAPMFDPKLHRADHVAGQVCHWQMSLEEASEISQYKPTIVAKACAKFEIGTTFYHTLDIVLRVWTIDNPENDSAEYVWMLRIWRSECLRLLSGKLLEDRSSFTIYAVERTRPKRFETFAKVVTAGLQGPSFPRDIPERRNWQSNPMDEEEKKVLKNALEQARPQFEGSSVT